MDKLIKLLDLSGDEITEILNQADQLKYETKHNIPHPILAGRSIGLLFQNTSTRTRISFEVGAYQLGAYGTFLNYNDLKLHNGESIEDTAMALSRYLDCIMVRTYDHSFVEKLFECSDVPVINGQTELAHPCQVLADLMTIREYKGLLKGLKVCYIGDGNNVANSLVVGALKTQMQVSVACPKGCEPAKQVLDFASEYSDFILCSDPKAAVEGADVVVTNAWSDKYSSKELFDGFCVNSQLLSLAKPDVLVLHSLPARKGEEISVEAFEAHSKEIFDETENRLHAQKAVMAILMGDGKVSSR